MLSYMVRSHNKYWTFKKTHKYHKMTKQCNVRWAFNASLWKPNDDEILAASSFIQQEEKERISKFVFQNDAKSSLIGRLMLRKYIAISTSISYEDIHLGRDDHGKPILLGAGDVQSNFNVSHQGDFVVLAGDTLNNIGVDVMKIEPPTNKNIPEFFRIMNRQFSSKEWQTIRSFNTETEQVACFYRHWCLKESYVKNTGFGITVNLAELSFDLKTRKLEIGQIVTDSTLYEKGVFKKNWVFEETLLDNKHAVAVAINLSKENKLEPVSYSHLSFEELVAEAKPLISPDVSFKDNFMKKESKNF